MLMVRTLFYMNVEHKQEELQLEVKLNSVLPLKSVTCPTHTARIDQTANSAHVEFAAQEYTPTRDFEVAVEVDARQAAVAMIPHRRGDDGYFLLMLTPPAGMRVLVATRPVDFRKGAGGLAALAKEACGALGRESSCAMDKYFIMCLIFGAIQLPFSMVPTLSAIPRISAGHPLDGHRLDA